MKYDKNEFTIVPNKSKRRGLSPNLQTVYAWLCEHSDENMQSFPSRKTLASECGMSVDTLDRSMRKLVELKMVKKSERKNGSEQTTNLYEIVLTTARSGTLAANSGGVAAKTSLGSRKNMTQNSTHLTTTHLTQNSTNVELAKAGNVDVNEMFSFWEATTGVPISARVKQNRFACNNLLKRHGPEKLRRLIEGVAAAQSDQYAPRIADFAQLQNKLNELIVWGKRRMTASKGVQL